MTQTFTSGRHAPLGAGTERKSFSEWSGWAYLPGIAFLVVGVLALAVPPLTSLAAGVYLGAMLLVAGAFALVGGLAHLRRHGAWLAVLLGLLSVIVGVATLNNPVVGAISLVWVLGAWLVLGGAFELAMSFTLPVGRGWLIFIGLIDLALGTFVVLMNPVEALIFLGYIVGASLIYRGVWSLVFTSNAHRLER